MTALAFVLAVLAFSLFGLATHEHHRKRLGRPLDPIVALRLRAAGWVALGTAFPPSVMAQGWVFGPILWIALLMLGAGLVFLALNFLPLAGTRRN